MRVLFTYFYGEENMERIRELGYTVDYIKEDEINHYEHKEDLDILICYDTFKYTDLKEFTSLKLILLSSIGFDQVPKTLSEDIIICNNRGGYSIPMGEWIVGKLLEMAKHTKKIYKNQENKKWHMDTDITELYNKKIVFLGTGTISKEAAKRLRGFDMNIIGLNTRGRNEEYFDACYKMEEAADIIKDADAIVISLPATESTYQIISKDIIDHIKDGCMFINISRGSVIDEAYLTEKLKENRFSAALDVFEKEPLAKDSALWDMENVYISSHNSWVSEMRNDRRFELIYKNLKRYINDEKLLNIIDLKRGY